MLKLKSLAMPGRYQTLRALLGGCSSVHGSLDDCLDDPIDDNITPVPVSLCNRSLKEFKIYCVCLVSAISNL